jgi:hypothetical protein
MCTRKILDTSFKSKEITMKQLIALIAAAFAVTAFATEPAKKVEAKPAASAAAVKPAASAVASAAAPAGSAAKKADAKK